jgi:hypothetical protein
LGVHSHHGHGIIYRARIGRPPDKPISTIGFLVHTLVRRGVLAMIDEDRENKIGPRFPRPVVIRTEYDRLCEDLGGPADIGVVGIEEKDLASYCQIYPSHRVLRVLTQYQRIADETSARKHWPWAAFAIGQYAFERQVREKYRDEPTPKDVAELLSKIEKTAQDLSSELRQLQALSYRLTDHTAPLRRAHLAWLDALVTQAASGYISPTVSEDGLTLLTVHSGEMDFLKRLADVQAAADHAKKQVDAKMLTRERSQLNPALTNFVFRCGGIWKSLTGRRPSANKIHSSRGTRDPDFVFFLQQLAKIPPAPAGHFRAKKGPVPVPTRDEVAISLRKFAPATNEENLLKSQV